MNASDVISVLALVVAIVSGIVNYIYTKRTFEASNYPAIDISLKAIHGDGSRASRARDLLPGRIQGQSIYPVPIYTHCLTCRLDNLSKEYPIMDIRVSLGIAKPIIWFRRWVHFEDLEESSKLNPGSQVCLLSKLTIEEFLTNELPSVLCPTKLPTEVTWPPALTVYSIQCERYRLLRKRTLDLLLTVIYRPGIFGAKLVRLSKVYKLVPRCMEERQDIVTSWDVQDVA
jgi:hypothetical protein